MITENKKIACFILSYEITKGMKSFGPIGLLKANNASKELVLCQIESLNKIFNHPDITILSGFGHEKLQKKIPNSINVILNDQFATKNHGYALKLILSNYDTKKYCGLFILDSGVLIKKKEPIIESLNRSYVLTQEIKKKQNDSKFLGLATDSSGFLEYIFYDIGMYSWCNSVYFSNHDIKNIIAKQIDICYDNMFLFELINKSISNDLLCEQIILNTNDVVSITGMKDKNKIK